jgi:hypothetical protein
MTVASLLSRGFHFGLLCGESCLGQPDAHAQRRGRHHLQPLTEPPSCTPPLFPRPVTVGEGIAPPVSAATPCLSVSTSHGSSGIRPLSWAP